MSARILLAEDNLINQRVVICMLARAGYAVDAVADGAEAVRACSTRAYDLVLMDWQMPEVDGLEATRQIRRLNMQQPVIIAVTARAQISDRDECLSSGMDDYLSKPFQSAQLVEMIRNALMLRANSN